MTPERYAELQPRLHTLLFDNPGGITQADIQMALKISVKECEDLLVTEIREGSLRNEGDIEGGELYFTNVKLRPPKPERDKPKPSKKAITAPGSLLVVASIFLLAIGMSLFGVWSVLFGEPPETPGKLPAMPAIVMPASPSANSIQEKVDATMAGSQRQEWSVEQKDLELRLKIHLAAGGGCVSQWKESEKCYVNGRLMSDLEHEQEKLEMEQRIVELKGHR